MTQLIEQFVDGVERPDGEAAWLSSAREQSAERFNALGIPTQKDEDWKYTSLRALANKQYSVNAGQADAEITLSESSKAHYRLVFSGGVLNSALSDVDGLPDGVQVMLMSEALKSNEAQIKAVLSSLLPEQPNAFAELNTALFKEGAYICIGKGCQLDKPIELVFHSSGTQSLALPRNLILLEQGAKAVVIERFTSAEDATGLCNSATEIMLADDSELDYHLIQLQGKKFNHIGGAWIQQGTGSRLNTRTITLGGLLVRNELNVSLNGEQAHANMTGLYYGTRRQHIDNHTTIRHAVPNCTSRELYKGILDDRARGVFHGRIVVEQDAQLTESEQENPNLLLSRDAEVDTKPQLEIYADDVKCSHGATVGELDTKQLFYMQSRGIGLAQAKTLLTYAFAAQVVEEIQIESLREELASLIADQMHITEL